MSLLARPPVSSPVVERLSSQRTIKTGATRSVAEGVQRGGKGGGGGGVETERGQHDSSPGIGSRGAIIPNQPVCVVCLGNVSGAKWRARDRSSLP